MKEKIQISEAEHKIMEVIWEAKEPLSSNDIRQRMDQRSAWERTTILTLIRRLVDKGFLKQEKRDVYYYSATVQREAYLKKETKEFVNRIYRGRSKDLIAALFEEKDLTKEDMAELKEYFQTLQDQEIK